MSEELKRPEGWEKWDGMGVITMKEPQPVVLTSKEEVPPPPPKEEVKPAPEEPKEEEKTAEAPPAEEIVEAEPPKKEKLYAGKYKSDEALEEAYLNAQREMSRAQAREKELERKMSEFEAKLGEAQRRRDDDRVRETFTKAVEQEQPFDAVKAAAKHVTELEISEKVAPLEKRLEKAELRSAQLEFNNAFKAAVAETPDWEDLAPTVSEIAKEHMNYVAESVMQNMLSLGYPEEVARAAAINTARRVDLDPAFIKPFIAAARGTVYANTKQKASEAAKAKVQKVEQKKLKAASVESVTPAKADEGVDFNALSLDEQKAHLIRMGKWGSFVS